MDRFRCPSSNVTAALLLAAAWLGASGTGQAQGIADFYKSRPVTLIIGFSAGNAYDVYGRAVGRFIGRHIPGNPTVIPQNMPGAGSLAAANYLYNVAPKDGSVIGIFSRSIAMEPLLGTAETKFDATKFSWLGSVGSEVSVCVAWHTSAVKNWNDLLTTNFRAGAASLSADTGIFVLVIRNLFGAKATPITGYPGGEEIGQAMENGEVDGRCGWSWSGVKSTKPSWIAEKKINILIQLGLKASPELPHVPLITDLATTDRQRQILTLVFSRQEMAWPFTAPPDIPAERKRALRAAFEATMKAPDFLTEAARERLEVNFVPGASIDRLIAESYATSPAILSETREIINAR